MYGILVILNLNLFKAVILPDVIASFSESDVIASSSESKD